VMSKMKLCNNIVRLPLAPVNKVTQQRLDELM
jgi:hypothetical protein